MSNKITIFIFLIIILLISGCLQHNANVNQGSIENEVSEFLIESEQPLSHVQGVLLREYLDYFDFKEGIENWDISSYPSKFASQVPFICPAPTISILNDPVHIELKGQYENIIIFNESWINIYFMIAAQEVMSSRIKRGLYQEAANYGLDIEQYYFMRNIGTAAMNNGEPICDVVLDGIHTISDYGDPNLNQYPLNPIMEGVMLELDIECSNGQLEWTMEVSGEPLRFIVTQRQLGSSIIGTGLLSNWSAREFEEKYSEALVE